MAAATAAAAVEAEVEEPARTGDARTRLICVKFGPVSANANPVRRSSSEAVPKLAVFARIASTNATIAIVWRILHEGLPSANSTPSTCTSTAPSRADYAKNK